MATRGLTARAAVVALAVLAVLGTGCRAITTGEDDGRGPGSSQDGGNGNGSGNGSGSGGGARTYDDAGPPASLAQQLLSGSVGNAVVEVDTTGRSLTGPARDGLAGALQEHGNKSVSFATSDTIDGGGVYSADDLRALASAHRDTSSKGNRMSVYVLVLDGRYEEEGVLGVAFAATAFAIFPDQIERGVLASLNYSRYEHAVVVHELGHLFGLVNLTGRGAFHEDPDNPGHSANRESVMYWAVEDVSVGSVFRGGPPTDFDADDVEEMSRIRG